MGSWKRKLNMAFSLFPAGKAGLGLLLLRAVVGAAAIILGRAFVERGNPTIWVWFVGLLAGTSGAFLLVGFLTQFAAFLAALAGAVIGLSQLSPLTTGLFGARLSILFLMSLATATLLLGPGAFSVDARLFGRREIIIPPRTRLPKHLT